MENTDQRLNCLTVEDAIRISKIICSAEEERLPIILDVFEKAGVDINGLDELEEWKALKDQAYIVDMDEFVKELTNGRVANDNNEVFMKSYEFEEVCRRFNVKPSCAKRALHRKGFIKTTQYCGKIHYTVPVWIEGRAERRVVILKQYMKKEGADSDGTQ